jgi:hypothetical protein
MDEVKEFGLRMEKEPKPGSGKRGRVEIMHDMFD